MNTGLVAVWVVRFLTAGAQGFLYATYAFLIGDLFEWSDVRRTKRAAVDRIGYSSCCVLKCARWLCFLCLDRFKNDVGCVAVSGWCSKLLWNTLATRSWPFFSGHPWRGLPSAAPDRPPPGPLAAARRPGKF